jgi:hypothetical protein
VSGVSVCGWCTALQQQLHCSVGSWIVNQNNLKIFDAYYVICKNNNNMDGFYTFYSYIDNNQSLKFYLHYESYVVKKTDPKMIFRNDPKDTYLPSETNRFHAISDDIRWITRE